MDRPPSFTAVTSTTLLEGLKDAANRTVWEQWVDRYRPLVLSYVRRVGVPASDAEDVTQTALLEFARAYRAGRYEREKGRLRSWLFGIVHNQTRSWQRRSGRTPHAVADGTEGGELLARVADPHDPEDVWNEEWRLAVLRQCLDEIRGEVRPTTMRAFELFAVEGLSAAEVAERLGTTANAVFVAKRRILGRVRELLPLMEDVW